MSSVTPSAGHCSSAVLSFRSSPRSEGSTARRSNTPRRCTPLLPSSSWSGFLSHQQPDQRLPGWPSLSRKPSNGQAQPPPTTSLPSHPTGRVTVEVCRQMTQFSTAVVYRLVPGGPDPPILPPPETSAVRISIWASEVLRRNEGKRVTIEGVQQKKSGLAHRDKAGDEPFLKTFGYESDITQRNPGIPYLRVCRSLSFAHNSLQMLTNSLSRS